MTRPIVTIICPDARTRDLLWRAAELTGRECYHVGDQDRGVDEDEEMGGDRTSCDGRDCDDCDDYGCPDNAESWV